MRAGPIGIIAFLWFMAVVRRRLGEQEDRLFSTVFLGGGLEYAMLTMTAAVAAAIPTLVVRFGDQPTPTDTAGAFVGPLDFLFPIWLVAVSATLLLTRGDRGSGRSGPRSAHQLMGRHCWAPSSYCSQR